MKYKRVWIWGGTASGKTTLAKKMSETLKLPHYRTDFMVLSKDWKKRLNEEERDMKVKKIMETDKWIIEGVHIGEWVMPLFKRADLIIILKINTPKRLLRLLKREMNDKNARLVSIIKMIYYTCIYNVGYFREHTKLIKEHNKKCMILRNQNEIDNFLLNLEKKP